MMILLLAGCASIPPGPEVAEGLVLSDRSYCLRDRGEAARALEYIEAVLQDNPRDPLALWRLARLEVHRGRLESAWRAARKAAEIAPGSADATLWAGYSGSLLLESRAVGERLPLAHGVERLLRQTLEIDPARARAHLGLAILSLALAEEPSPVPCIWPDARVHLEMARKLRPGLPRTHLLLARLALQRNDLGRAMLALETLSGPPLETREGLLYPDAQIGEWHAASEMAQAMLEALPGSKN